MRFGTNDFTIEGWFYADSYNSITYPTIISKYDNGDASWIARIKSDGKFVWYAGQVGGGTNNTTSSAVLALNRWFHFAVCRDCLLYTSPSPRDRQKSRMPSSA